MRLPKLPPALVLFFLSPVIGELLSGSSPPAEFFTPFGFTLMVSLYGSGAVIVRELKVRWKKGVGSVLLLGAAYGVLEEGLMVTSWFSPFWPDLGIMSSYGRWLGVNWIWAEMLTIYHAVFSITIPIILVELAYSSLSEQKWVGKKTFTAVAILLAGVTVFGTILFSLFMKYWTSPVHYAFAIGLIMLFGYAAYRLPNSLGKNGQKQLPRPRKLWAIATVASFAFFLGYYSLPSLVPAVFSAAILLYGPVLVYLFAKLLTHYDWNSSRKNRHILAVVSGGLSFMIVFAVLQELDKTRADNTSGMALVSLAFIVGLILLNRRVQHGTVQQPLEQQVVSQS